MLKGGHEAGQVQSMTPGIEGSPSKWLSFSSVITVICSRESTGSIQLIKRFLNTSNSEAVEGLIAQRDNN